MLTLRQNGAILCSDKMSEHKWRHGYEEKHRAQAGAVPRTHHGDLKTGDVIGKSLSFKKMPAE